MGGGGQIRDVIHSDTTVLRDWEEFQLISLGNSYYAIKTVEVRVTRRWLLVLLLLSSYSFGMGRILNLFGLLGSSSPCTKEISETGLPFQTHFLNCRNNLGLVRVPAFNYLRPFEDGFRWMRNGVVLEVAEESFQTLSCKQTCQYIDVTSPSGAKECKFHEFELKVWLKDASGRPLVEGETVNCEDPIDDLDPNGFSFSFPF